MNSHIDIPKQETVPKTPLAFFRFVSKPYRIWLWIAIFLVIIASAAATSTSYFFKLIIDAVERGDVEATLQLGLLYPVAILCVQLVYRASGVAGMNATVKSAKYAADTLLDYLLRHNHTYFINRFAGSITNKVRNVTGALEDIIPDFLWSQLTAVVSFLVTFILIFSVDPLAAGIFIALLVALAFVNKFLAKEKTIRAKLNAEAGTALQGGMSDVVSNVSAMRQYVQLASELSCLGKLTQEKQRTALANWGYTEKLLLINVLVIFFFVIMMFWSLIHRWESGLVSAGDFVLVLALISQITGAMVFIGRAVNATARAVGELREALDDLLIPYDIVDASNARSLQVSAGEINFRDVTFSYENIDIFNKFNLRIKGKERLGLVGHSGAGKSTIVSLLLRQYDLNMGEINIDGSDISSITQDSLRQSIAVVPQEPMLFHRSIRENIAYARPEADLSEVVAVAKLAYAHDFIESLPEGYDTVVGERGVKLSGGQKQRVAIARAMFKNAPILILDEATSALDSESEQLIQKALHTLMAGKTVIAIAHRLSTLMEMDRIVVLEAGKVVEDGKHDELRQSDGIYSRLWSHQTGGFLSD